MHRQWDCFGAFAASVFLMCWGGQAEAGKTPEIGPVPGWVRPAPDILPISTEAQGLPVAVTLSDNQFSFDADGWTIYRELRAKIQTPAGLQELSSIPFAWSPWSDTLVFHKLAIIRDGQTIDLLPHDGIFTILRRETGLDQATLTGELTTLIQPDGLQVGDEVDIVTSVRHAAPLMKGLNNVIFNGWDQFPLGRMRMQARWPASLPMHWKESIGLAPLVETRADGMQFLTLKMDGVRPLVPPAQAPPRFQHGREIDFTAFQSWSEVASFMAPLYLKAGELAPGSSVAAQAAAIATHSTDPKVRAAEALQLVQSKVRYLLHAEADGSYVPQSADDTWRLRYGDCKAKTVLLIALLRELGVSAEPVLVNTVVGDGLDQHLPSLLFDHVLVRVKLNGRNYWLDGARVGDRTLDDLETPGYGWVLPLGAPQAQLLHIEPSSPAKPQITQIIRYDSSAGVTSPERSEFKTILRGDLATLFHQQLAAMTPVQQDEALKRYWGSEHTAFTPAHMASGWDPVTGEETLTADGKSELDWSGTGLELQNVEFGGKPDVARDKSSFEPDAPYLVGFPSYVESELSVVLPPGVHPTEANAKAVNFDQILGGVAYRRVGSISGNVFRVTYSRKALQSEVSAVEARAAVEPLTAIGEQGVYISGGSLTSAAENAKALKSHPTDVAGYTRRGSALLDAGRFQEGLGDYEAAIALDPKSQDGWAGRAIAHAWLGNATAYSDADTADSLGDPEIVSARARGLIAAQLNKYAEARAAFAKALQLQPNDAFSMRQMVEASIKSGERKQAYADLDALLKAHPELEPQGSYFRMQIEHEAHDDAAASRELSTAPAETVEQLIARAYAYWSLGEKELARRDVDAAIKIEPTADNYVTRARFTDADQKDSARADIEAALKLDPTHLDAELWKVNEATHSGDFPTALQLMGKVVAEHPDARGNLLVGRAQIHGKLKQIAEMNADFEAARTSPHSSLNLEVLCAGEVEAYWKPELAQIDCQKALDESPASSAIKLNKVMLMHRLGHDSEASEILNSIQVESKDAWVLNVVCWGLATSNLNLERALSFCDASLKLRPDSAATLDSRGLVLLRLGRNAEALAAYDAALKVEPKEWSSLYGKSLAEAHLGRKDESARDRAAALLGRPEVAENYEKWGVS